jgi:hypothetical protein
MFRGAISRIREQRIKGGRRIEVLAPLFPSYAFLQILNGWHHARWSIGVLGLIMDSERPAVVRTEISPGSASVKSAAPSSYRGGRCALAIACASRAVRSASSRGFMLT